MHTSLLSGRYPVDCHSITGGCKNISPTVAILGTPVIDANVVQGQATTGTLYAVVETQDCPGQCAVSSFQHMLYAVDISALTVTSSVQVFPPGWMTFDGANIWVPSASQGNGSVYKLRAKDGKVVGTFTVGVNPITSAFDGANVWVVNGGGNGTGNVTKLRASDGTVLGTFNVGLAPIGIVFDGANIWVANNGSDSVSKLRASDGSLLGTFNVGSILPYGLAFDGANIWVTGSPYVVELRASDGTQIGLFRLPNAGTGVAFDGANIWVNFFSSVVAKM
jgi:sugar lactone lactonase YvrE